MAKKIIITGATGTAGAEALRQALINPNISQVTVLARRPLGSHIVSNPPPAKLNFVKHDDFLSYPPSLIAQLKGHDAVLWDLGVSSIGFKEDAYTVITNDYTLAAARAFATIERDSAPDDKFVFAFLSGEGASQVEGKAAQMFGRVKGRTELALAELRDDSEVGSKLTTFSFRPAGIAPIHPIPDAPRLMRFLAPVMFPIFKTLYPPSVVNADVLARGMLHAALTGASGTVPGWAGKGLAGDKAVFDCSEIKKLAKQASEA